MDRRAFMRAVMSTGLAVPLITSAQQPVMPAIGFLDPRSPENVVDRLRGFRQGLNGAGFIEGETARIDYRWAENHLDKLPALAMDLVRRRVAVIVASGGADVAFAAKRATTSIPILFLVSEDPVGLGLVTSLGRPDSNLTGIDFLSTELVAKRLDGRYRPGRRAWIKIKRRL